MYLVTGGAGFIGSHLVARLSEAGETVVVCDWLHADHRWQNLAKHEVADIISPEALEPWLRRCAPSLKAVLHMGAISSTTESDVDLIVRYNVRATLDLLQWCTDTRTRFIYASSAATYGDGSAGFEDDASPKALGKLRPLNAYGWSKQLIDRRIARLTNERRALPPQCAGLKFFNVYGPNEYHKGDMRSVIAQNFATAAHGEPLRLFRSYRAPYPDGGQLRDFIYVRDCVDVMMWLLEHPDVSGLLNVGSGRARSWVELAQALFAALGREPRIEFIDMPPDLRERYQYFTEARLQRLRAAGYGAAFTSLEDGVADYVRNYLSAADPYR